MPMRRRVMVRQPARAQAALRHPASRLGAGGVVRVAALLVAACFFAIPLVWLILAPTKTDDQLVSLNPLAVGTPAQIWTAWQHLLLYNDREMLTWAKNSVVYSLSSLLLTLGLCLPAGYALAIARFTGRKAILLLTLLAMIMPGAALILPLYLEVNAAHLINTALSVILPSAFYPLGVYLSFIYFSTSMPRELLYAGRVDGCSEVGLFGHIALPLAKPIASLIAFFAFVGSWNNYMLPWVMLSDDTKFNLPVGLAALISGTPALNPAQGGSQIPILRPEVALAGIIVVLPIVVVLMFSQRFVKAGLLVGAEKG
jgi:multiple sugar transport system permease protein